MLSLAIDLSSSILLCHFICTANRASGGIYLILFSLDWSIPFAISVLEAKQLYLDCWWTQIKHLFPPSPSFLSCLHFFPLRAMGELLLYGPFISICILFSPIIFFVLSSSLLFPLSHPLLTFQHFLSVPDAWLRLQEFWAARSQIHTL